MRPPWHKSGGTGWLVLFAGIVAWDVLAPETLTTAFRRLSDTPAGKAALVAGWSVLTAHLFDMIPEHADPIHVVPTKLGQRLRPRGEMPSEWSLTAATAGTGDC